MPKLSPADAKDVESRSLPLVVALSVVTLCLGYPIYLCWQWARELNGLRHERRHSPQVVLILSILTLGIGAIIYECLFAQELEQHFSERGQPDGMPHLSTWVIALNVSALVLSFTGIGLVLAIPCGLAATCLVQMEFNKLAAGAPAFVR